MLLTIITNDSINIDEAQCINLS